MLSFLPSTLLGIICIGLIVLNTLIWAVPVYVLALTKYLVRFKWWQIRCARYLMAAVNGWIWGTLFSLKLTQKITWDIEGAKGLTRKEWYFVNSNHQSWTDILVLLRTFGYKIPFPKFFIKKELFWIPIMGTAWWALDYPYMKRYSREYLEKYPEKRGKDLETTKKMCERYRHTPVSILNFIEGTRFTPEKHKRQESPYRHLLRPKAGGFAFALNAMDGKIKKMLDVTIVYPQGAVRFWDFLCGRISPIVVRVKEHVIPEEFLHGNYLDDEKFRDRFQGWVRELWEEKDRFIDRLIREYRENSLPKESP
jgi:1-acyl-sn-glycerol-3-phosphate acyltransferase